jgi:hypothetical protein
LLAVFVDSSFVPSAFLVCTDRCPIMTARVVHVNRFPATVTDLRRTYFDDLSLIEQMVDA